MTCGAVMAFPFRHLFLEKSLKVNGPSICTADHGALAQLGERLICIQEVRSSILLGSTIFLDLTAKHCVSVWPSNRTAERRELLVFYIV